MGRMAERHAAQAAGMGRKVGKPWRKVRGRRWKALRARMRALRDDARERKHKANGASHNAGGSGKYAGTGATARLPVLSTMDISGLTRH